MNVTQDPAERLEVVTHPGKDFVSLQFAYGLRIAKMDPIFACKIARQYNAATEMLAALQMLIEHDGMMTGGDWTVIRDAIAKATGEPQ